MKTPLIPALVLLALIPLLSAGAEEVTLTPIMDAAVSEAAPGQNYATSNLAVGKSSGQVWESFLRFDLSGIPVNAEITAAELRLSSSNFGTGGILRISKTDAGWAEGAIQWATRPAATTLADIALTVENATTAHLPLTAPVLAHLQDLVRGVVLDRGIKLEFPTATTGQLVSIHPRESGTPPQLFITYALGTELPDFTADLGPTDDRLRAALFQSPEGAPSPFELVWNTKPGVRYRLWKSTDLDAWDVMPGYPREAENLADSELLPGPDANEPGAFFRVEVLDEQPPVIESRFPADGAFAIRRFYPSRSEVGVLLSDATGIDPDSISLTLSGRGTFTLDSPELSFGNGLLSFETGGDLALGGYGETISVSLSISDPIGNATTYEWSFVMEEEVVLAADLLVFGSGEAQRSGQRLPYTPTRMLAGDPGPIRANNNGWALVEVTADTLVIEYEASAPSFPVDQYLTNRTPRTVDEIFYRKVVSTSDNPANQRLTITTVNVPAFEIMRAGSASLSGEEVAFEVDDAGNIIAARSIRALEASGEFKVQPVVIDWSGKEIAGFYTKPDNTTGMVVSLNLEDEAPGGADWDGKLKLKQARLQCSPTLTVAAKTSFLRLEKFYAEAKLDVDAIIEPEFEFYSADLASADLKKTLWRHDFIIPIAGTPLWITVTPRLNAKAEFSAGLSGSFSVGASGGFTDTMIVDYLKDRDPALKFDREIGDFRFDLIDPEITLSGDISASATIEPEIEVKLVSLVGFYVNVDPTVYAGLSAAYTPPDLISAEATLGVRASLNAGMAITAVDDSLLPAFQPWQLFDEGWTWSFPNAIPDAPLVITSQPQSVNVPTGGTVRLRVQTNHTTGVSYQWFKDGRRLLDNGSELVRYGASAGTVGDYKVVVSNGGQTVTSRIARVLLTSNLHKSPSPSTITVNGEEYLLFVYDEPGAYVAPSVAFNRQVEFLLIGGGGGGGPDDGGWNVAGGGGAGEMVEGNKVLISQDIIYVGDGGQPGHNGEKSFFGQNIATGGGSGGIYEKDTQKDGSNGGSGGGGGTLSNNSGYGFGGISLLNNNPNGSSFGHKGGDGYHLYTNYAAAGGGGGAGAPGQNYTVRKAGNGGFGRISEITGVEKYYAGGGGGRGDWLLRTR